MSSKIVPDILSAQTHEELDALTIEHAKYFTVVQVILGGFVKTGLSNYEREEAPTLEAARQRAKDRHEETGKPSMIYAVADFVGARGFSRHVENYPLTKSPFKNKPLRKEVTPVKSLLSPPYSQQQSDGRELWSGRYLP